MAGKTDPGKIIRGVSTFLLVLGLIIGGWLVSRQFMQREPEEQLPVSEPSSQASSEVESAPDLELHKQLYPVGGFGPDEEREAYESGTMLLEIPRLEFTGPVLDGVDEETLKGGVGLFDQAQLPGVENRNVSIAGHRDVYGEEFYYIDTIQEGDRMYLTWQGKRYVYEYEQTFITHDHDWDPIRVREYSCITLQSCTPINVATERIFVVGKLVDVEDAPDSQAG